MKLILTAVGVMTLTSGAFATDLWNQQSGLNTSDAYINDNFSDQAKMSTFSVSDVVASSAWTIQSVSLLMMTNGGASALSLTSATLNIFSNSGSSPSSSNDPTQGTTVSISVTSVGNSTYLVTASGLNISLAKGEYWIGLTPTSSFNSQGEMFSMFGTTNSAGANNYSNYRNPQGGFGLGTNWFTGSTFGTNSYEAIDIQGVVPAPEPISTAVVIGALATAIAKRRKRA